MQCIRFNHEVSLPFAVSGYEVSGAFFSACLRPRLHSFPFHFFFWESHLQFEFPLPADPLCALVRLRPKNCLSGPLIWQPLPLKQPSTPPLSSVRRVFSFFCALEAGIRGYLVSLRWHPPAGRPSEVCRNAGALPFSPFSDAFPLQGFPQFPLDL